MVCATESLSSEENQCQIRSIRCSLTLNPWVSTWGGFVIPPPPTAHFRHLATTGADVGVTLVAIAGCWEEQLQTSSGYMTHGMMYRKTPTAKNYLAQNVPHAVVEKHCLKWVRCILGLLRGTTFVWGPSNIPLPLLNSVTSRHTDQAQTYKGKDIFTLRSFLDITTNDILNYNFTSFCVSRFKKRGLHISSCLC